ncbi:Qat anti-phage system QueC-like protein QatC [Dysgonomonas sp. GY617]|uniref:Qat anti-phage system QueC-like protein QatC n=1 Tax=Dysgonomonas sp. GY617 TaxID=2780420 RepID=UPI001884884D|nr:Qat anti-phage system QueC-like protein QatC [Dysgonomonas sp. GY617]MBF0577597.1 7-cyano-7-deazaguanine synthase [Dysgonomonas sp. GY617]
MKSIVCRLNQDDTFSKEDADITVDLFSKNQYRYTFWDDNRRKLYQCNSFSRSAIDLLNISLMVYYADRKILRRKEDDAWTRQIKLYMPVLEINKWNQNKLLLEKMLSFLSGDIWVFEFRERELNEKETTVEKGMKLYKKNKHEPKAICMLSGGLDSFIGAIDILNKEKDVWFVGHYGGGKGVINYQKNVIEKLISQYQLSDQQFFNFYASPLNGIEDTTRTRSFMFFAHAIILGSMTNDNITLYIPENGLISLNIPLTNTRLGSSSTRTTHPYYMTLLQQLLVNLEIKVKLYNPYQFKTKGEMIEKCNDLTFLEVNISETMSCSHPDLARYTKEPPSHCGNCLPCVIRRAAIEYAYKNDTSNYRDKDFKNTGASENLRSFKLGIRDYVNSKIDTALSVQISGPIVDQIDNYCGVYRRGINELKTLLDKYNG